MVPECDSAVVGAGPYGLSVAAHLHARGADFRVFGRPLDTWRSAMPRGMYLKSDGFASSLSAPEPGAKVTRCVVGSTAATFAGSTTRTGKPVTVAPSSRLDNGSLRSSGQIVARTPCGFPPTRAL